MPINLSPNTVEGALTIHFEDPLAFALLDAQAKIASLKQELADERAAAEIVVGVLGDAMEEIVESAYKLLGEADEEVATLKGTIEDLAFECDEQDEEILALSDDVRLISQERDAHRDARTRVGAENLTLHAENTTLRASVAELGKENEALRDTITDLKRDLEKQKNDWLDALLPPIITPFKPSSGILASPKTIEHFKVGAQTNNVVPDDQRSLGFPIYSNAFIPDDQVLIVDSDVFRGTDIAKLLQKAIDDGDFNLLAGLSTDALADAPKDEVTPASQTLKVADSSGDATPGKLVDRLEVGIDIETVLTKKMDKWQVEDDIIGVVNQIITKAQLGAEDRVAIFGAVFDAVDFFARLEDKKLFSFETTHARADGSVLEVVFRTT